MTPAAVCQCGNVFMDDAIFCRKCGTKRRGVEPKPATGGTFPDEKVFPDGNGRTVTLKNLLVHKIKIKVPHSSSPLF